MIAADFDKLLEDRLAKIKSVLASKATEYASLDDRLHNFKVAAKFKNETPGQACVGMMIKHLVSILDFVEREASNGTIPTEAILDEKIGDTINYFILLEAIYKEKK